MAIIRVNKNKNYSVMSNNHFKEKEMSLKAKGLLSEMLSLPDNWNYSIAGLVSINKESKNTIISILEELKNFGYLKVTKKYPNETNSGRIEYVYDIYEEKQEPKKQGLEFQGLEKQGLEFCTQYNTNNKILNNKKLNKNINIVEQIIDYLNEVVGSKYKSTTRTTRDKINARLNEGFTVEDFKTVINKKAKEWGGTAFEQYLRPETLFGTKFESYLNQRTHTEKEPEWYGKQISEVQATEKEMQELEKRIKSL